MERVAKDVMTVLDLCAYLQLSEAKVREMLRRGQLPAVVIGRQWRIRKSAIDEWLARQERERPQYPRRPARDPVPSPKPPGQQGMPKKADPGARKPLSARAPAELVPEERRQLARTAIRRERQERGV